MSLTVRHLGKNPSATVVRGLDSAAAVSHLSHSLEAGTGFDDPIVVSADPPTFLTTKDAIQSGQRYFRLVTGARPAMPEIRLLASVSYDVASTVVATAVGPLRAGIRLVASFTRCGPG